MSSEDVAIKVQGLSKCFEIYETPRDRLKQFVLPRFQRVFGRSPRQYYREFWALKDVSFEVKKGETVGIVGKNGSGKSTLLQLICGTLSPTGGSVQTNGRIAALLELGSGFNPEFTGRENVYMNGALLGLSKSEVDARFDDIVKFADIGDFVDQPVKMYSSGMVVRLAFAVAINVDPQILVVDEALSVGDELFQRKCFSRIEAIKNKGATILFVSHSGSTIVELCDRAFLFDRGEFLIGGAPKSIVGRYQRLLYAPIEAYERLRREVKQKGTNSPSEVFDSRDRENVAHTEVESVQEAFFDTNLISQSTISYESRGALIEEPHILDSEGKKVNNLVPNCRYRYIYTVKFLSSSSNVRFGMLCKTLSGVELGGSVSALVGRGIEYIASGDAVKVEFSFDCRLNPGTYFLNAGVLGLCNEEETYLHRLLDACIFRVLPSGGQLTTGVVNLDCKPHVVALGKLEYGSL